MSDKQLPKALQLAELMQAAVQTYPQQSEDEPGGYCTQVDQLLDEATAELIRLDAREDELLHHVCVLQGMNDESLESIRALTAELEQARAALAAQGEPVCYAHINANGKVRAVLSEPRGPIDTPLYTAPPAPAKPMTDEEIRAAVAPVTTLWCIHIPGPDELYAAPSKADADHMAALHNAAMATYYASGALNLEYAPLLESVQAVAIPWPHDTQSHADQMREFDWSGWGITDKGGA